MQTLTTTSEFLPLLNIIPAIAGRDHTRGTGAPRFFPPVRGVFRSITSADNANSHNDLRIFAAVEHYPRNRGPRPYEGYWSAAFFPAGSWCIQIDNQCR